MDTTGRMIVVNFWTSSCGPFRFEQPDLNATRALLPDTEAVLFDVPYLSLFDPVSDLAGRFRGIGARCIP